MAVNGIKNCYFAVMPDENSDSYSTPVSLSGAVSIDLAPTLVQRSRAVLGGYGGRNYINYVNGAAGTLSVMELPIAFYVGVLGYRYENGCLRRYAVKKPVHFALLYETKDIIGGYVSGRRKVWYDCICNGFPDNLETIAEVMGATPFALSITAYSRLKDGAISNSVRLIDDPDKYNNFFKAVL